MAPSTPKPTDPVTLRATMADGTEHETTTTERMYMCLADRVQFERRFNVSFGELRINSAAGIQHDEWIAFFVWRALARGVPALSQVSFDDFVEAAAELDIIRVSDDVVAETPPGETPEQPADRPVPETEPDLPEMGQPEYAQPDPTPREPAPVP